MSEQSEVLSEILEDYLARIRSGEQPDPEEYVLRHPQLATRILQVLPAAGLMERMAANSDEQSHGLLLDNPYLSRLMIEDATRFFGRERELARVFSRIGSQRPQSVSIVGERRIGKSSLLNALTWPQTRSRFLGQPDAPLFVFIDFQQLPGISLDGFFDLLLKKIQQQGELAELVSSSNRYQLMQLVLEQLGQKSRPLILLLDEFDCVTSNEEFDSDFFSFLRSCANSYAVAFVTSSRNDLQRLCHSSAIADSPFFNIFSSLYLKGFRPNEARDLIEEPSATAGVPLAPFQDKILTLSGSFPFYIQIACSTYFEQLATDPDALQDEEIRDAFLEEAAPHMSYFWERCHPQEREVLRRVGSGRPPEPEQLFWCKALERSGYLIKSEGRYLPFSEAFSRQISLLDSLSEDGTLATRLRVGSSLTELGVGQKIQQYRVLLELGQGGMGIVYLAEDAALFRKVVLKLCRPDLVYSPSARRRAVREARTAAALQHPGIAGVYELLDYHGLPVIVMEWIDGRTLAEYLEEKGPVPWRHLCEWMVQTCEALAHAHSQGLIHRDIKTSNLMITSDGQLKLTDFGLAKWQIEKDFTSHVTATGGILGTVNYMSPEQARGEALDQRSDLFSLGVLFFEALTGKLPFQRSDLPATLQAILTDPMPVLGLYHVENCSWTRYCASSAPSLRRSGFSLPTRPGSISFSSSGGEGAGGNESGCHGGMFHPTGEKGNCRETREKCRRRDGEAAEFKLPLLGVVLIRCHPPESESFRTFRRASCNSFFKVSPAGAVPSIWRYHRAARAGSPRSSWIWAIQ